jgi:hypothetical protein
MTQRARPLSSSAAALLGLVFTAQVHALIFTFSGDPSFNASAPTGPLADSGWQFQGLWQGSLSGTPIAPNYFITANHAGGGVGNAFVLGGVTYHTTAGFAHPTADLTIWQVDGTFPSYAPLYTGSDEVGQSAMLFGRSATRGAPVIVPGTSPAELDGLRGWHWGGPSPALRWGENVIDEVLVDPDNGNEYLLAEFNYDGGPNEATLAGGDSGGALFLLDSGIWKLAGINVAVEADFRLDPGTPSPFSAIFDAGGLYADQGSGYELVADQATDLPASLYSVRLSAYQDWIQSTVPEPVSSPVVVAGALLGLGFVGWLSRRLSPTKVGK